MPYPTPELDWTAAEPQVPIAAQSQREEPMDEEEKLMAGRPDVDMPALLTRDVLGG